MTELREGFDHLPLGDVIRHLTGSDLELYQDQLAHAGLDDPFWSPLDYSDLLKDWTVPTLLVDGWHDYPLPRVLEDYAALRTSPAPVRLRIGAGGHLGGGGEGGMTDAPLAWFDTYLRGEAGLLPERRVTIEVQGEAGGRRDLDDWPPPAEPKRWYLRGGGRLATEAPDTPTLPDLYRYDPAEPTPSIGGIGMLTGGPVDNRELEARPDVLVYTSDPLADPLVLIGAVSAELWVNSSLDHTDFFVRLCDVSPDGESINICDGLRRLSPTSIRRSADGTFGVSVPMWPAGHRLGAGHCLRVQVSSGAHPVYARNLGTGEPVATATFMQPAEQAVYHEPGKLSFVTLPHASD
jgi:putative CocE/NonD family hydrolase